MGGLALSYLIYSRFIVLHLEITLTFAKLCYAFEEKLFFSAIIVLWKKVILSWLKMRLKIKDLNSDNLLVKGFKRLKNLFLIESGSWTGKITFGICLNQGRFVGLVEERVAWGWGELCKIPSKEVEQRRGNKDFKKVASWVMGRVP